MENTKPVGTKKSGYAGPEFGPFNCVRCVHFSHGYCNHPDVVSDPQMTVEDGKAEVDAFGCCTYFRPPAVNNAVAVARSLAKK